MLIAHGDRFQVRPVPWFGSPDLRGVAAAYAFVVLPPGDMVHQAGAEFEVLVTEDFV